jgi:CheY-like chemotaxis protein
MTNHETARVYHILDVCPCSFDHADMRQVVSRLCTARMEQVRTAASALERMEQQRYDLVLINRTLDGPMDGLGLLAALRARGDAPSAMLISNYADAQASASALGALPGFGRAQLDTHAPHCLARALNLPIADAPRSVAR